MLIHVCSIKILPTDKYTIYAKYERGHISLNKNGKFCYGTVMYRKQISKILFINVLKPPTALHKKKNDKKKKTSIEN